MKKMIVLLLIPFMVLTVCASPAMAASTGLKEGAASLLVPGWGQYLNGEFSDEQGGRIKSGIMVAIEIAAIVTTAVVGGVAGWPVVWVGIGLFIANHAWSAIDAFVCAEQEPGVALGTKAPSEKASQI
ncbi:MAG: hypothetical protein PHN49_02635 [Candidatus Omnitrophica bacterium]|nr:hypothetical protein [Candidatus Omnitrophota bacterium]MDD5670515.1 hypothetical protein [Candidatus Omnitrophota bacterium]